jgi:hypothetical protein
VNHHEVAGPLAVPRLVGRAKRLPVPNALQGMDFAPRHLALLAYLQYDGLTVSELADRLESRPPPSASWSATCPAAES